MGQLGPKRGQNEVLCHFHVQNAQFSPVLHIMLVSYGIQQLVLVKVLKKLLALKMGPIRAKKAQMRLLAMFMLKMHSFQLIMHIMIGSYDIQQLVLVRVLKKFHQAQLGPEKAKIRSQAIFMFKMHRFFPIFHIMIQSYDIWQVVVVQVLKKNRWP